MFVSSDTKRFFKSAIIVLLCLIFADWVVGRGLTYLYYKQTSGALYRSSYALNSTRADILIFGSSRASHHYDTEVLSQKLGTTAYNCGRDGMGIIYSAAMVSAINGRYKPKCVIIDIRQDEFTTSDAGKISPLFPYHNNSIIGSYLHYNGSLEWLKFTSNIYPYNSILINILLGLTSYDKNRTEEHNGYLPLTGTNPMQYINLAEKEAIDTAKVNCFKNLLFKLDKAGIYTIIAISPAYSNNIDGPTVKLATQISSAFKTVKFINFTHDALYSNASYFFDISHLNKEGARVFSADLATHIQAYTK